MRTFLLPLMALFVAGCATTSPTDVTKVYDQKTNTYRYAAKPSQDEFVGTSAGPQKPVPTWYRFGHP